MKNKYYKLWLIGLMVIIFTYIMIIITPRHSGVKFVKTRLNFIGQNNIKQIDLNQQNKILDSEVGLTFNFKNINSYSIVNNENKFLILEYKNDMETTDIKTNFVNFIQEKSKQEETSNLDFKDFSKINELKEKLKKATNLRKNFDFNANSNYIIIKLKGTTNTLDKIVRLLH